MTPSASCCTGRVWPAPAGWDVRRLWSAGIQTANPRTATVALTAFRSVIALYLLGVITTDWSTNHNPATYLCFLTIWGLIHTLLYHASSATLGIWVLASTRSQIAGDERITIADKPAFKHLTRMVQILFQNATVLETIILTLYWSLLYTGAYMPPLSKWINSSVHGVAAVSLWVDLLFGCNRPLDNHVGFVALTGLLYLCVNVGITLRVEVLYPVLTWREAKSAVLVAGTMVALFVVYYGVSLVALLRDTLSGKCSRRGGSARRVGNYSLAAGVYEPRTGLLGSDAVMPTDEAQPWMNVPAFRDRAAVAFFMDAAVAFPCGSIVCCRRCCKCPTEPASDRSEFDSEAPVFAVHAGKGFGDYTLAEQLSDAHYPL